MADLAWREDRACCLALMFRLERAKANKKNFYRAMVWLFKTRFDTLSANLVLMAEDSGIECLLDLLMFVMHETGKGRRQYGLEVSWKDEISASDTKNQQDDGLAILQECDQKKWNACDGESAVELDVGAKKQQLYDRVADIIADGLRTEMEACDNGHATSGRFCLNAPSGQRMHDKATDIVAGVASRLFKEEGSVERKIQYQRLLTTLRRSANDLASQPGAAVTHSRPDRMARLKTGNKAGASCCFNCGRPGHWKFRCPSDFEIKTVTIQVQSSDTVQEVKQKIEAEEGTPCSQQQLIFMGQKLEEHETLPDGNIHQHPLSDYIPWADGIFDLVLQFKALLIFLQPATGQCYCCGERGHWKSACPMAHFYKTNLCHPEQPEPRWRPDKVQYSGLSEDVAVCRQNRRTPCYRVPNAEAWRDHQTGKTVRKSQQRVGGEEWSVGRSKKSKKANKPRHKGEVFDSKHIEMGEHSRSELQSHLNCIARLEERRRRCHFADE